MGLPLKVKLLTTMWIVDLSFDPICQIVGIEKYFWLEDHKKKCYKKLKKGEKKSSN